MKWGDWFNGLWIGLWVGGLATVAYLNAHGHLIGM